MKEWFVIIIYLHNNKIKFLFCYHPPFKTTGQYVFMFYNHSHESPWKMALQVQNINYCKSVASSVCHVSIICLVILCYIEWRYAIIDNYFITIIFVCAASAWKMSVLYYLRKTLVIFWVPQKKKKNQWIIVIRLSVQIYNLWSCIA